MQPEAACQGRQARSPGSDVTASSGTAISTMNFDMFRNFVKISFKFDVALKHAQDEVPVKKAPQKIRNRRPRRTRTGDD